MAAGLGGPGLLSGLRRPRRPPAPLLRARHVPVPLGRPPPRARGGLQRRRRDRAVPMAPGLQRPASDRLGLVRAPRRERGDQARDPSEGMDLREHRAPGRVVQADGLLVRLDAAAPQQRPRVLPLDAVAVPEALRDGAGLPEERAGQLVPERPDRAGERAGDQRRLRTVRHRGGPQGPHAVVLQDHRLRATAPRRHGHARGMARARDHDAAELDRAVRGRHGAVHRRGDRRRGRGLHHAPRHLCGASRSSCSLPSTRW